MKKWLTTIASLATIVALLSGSFAVANDGPNGGYTDDTVIVRVYYPDPDTGNKAFISFEPWIFETNYQEGYHLMKVTQREIDLLTDAGLQVVVADQQRLPMLQSISGYPCYRTVEETFAFAEALATTYPDLATWTDVGNSWEKSAGLGGYDMMVLRLTNSAIPGPKPKLFVTSAIHAREDTTAPLLVRFAEYLTDNYGTDADATWILDHHEVHLMLHTNPDGRKKAEAGLSWRKNTNQNYCGATSNYRGADLNRNFSYQWSCCGGSSGYQCSITYRGPSAASEPETQAVQNYLRAQFPDQRGSGLSDPAPDDATGIYLDIHSYSELVLWPWGFTSDTAPNGTQLQTLGRKFAYWNHYEPQQATGLYVTDGTADDFAYGELGIATYTFELGTAFFQSCSTFENTIVPDNLPALLYAAKVVRTPYMTPSGPDAYDLSLSDDPVPAGTPVTLSGTVDDTRYNNSNGTEPTQDVAAAEYYVDTPPWVTGSTAIAMSASDGSFDSKTENAEATMDTAGLSDGKHILFVRGQDVNGNWGAFSAIFLNVTQADDSIAGYVTGPEGGANPLAGIRVDIRGHGSSFTDQNGHYSFEELDADRYQVAPYDDGYNFAPVCNWIVIPPGRGDVSFVGVPTSRINTWGYTRPSLHIALT
jgi:carboxypeptidase T